MPALRRPWRQALCCVPPLREVAAMPATPCRPALFLALGLALAAPLAAQEAQAPAPPREEPPLPEKILNPPPLGVAPTVNIRQIDNGDTVEEYRVNGRLTMVKVTPKRGAPYTLLDSNGDGRLDRKDAEGPVAPVYWTLYEWD
jgi:hypothetical protein